MTPGELHGHHVALAAVTALYVSVKSPTVVIIGLLRMGGSADIGGLCYHPVAGWGQYNETP